MRGQWLAQYRHGSYSVVRVLVPISLVALTSLCLATALRAADTALQDTKQAGRQSSEDGQLGDYLARHRDEMTRVTQRPYHVSRAVAWACAPAFIPSNPHGERWVHVFVSSGGTNAMTSGRGAYPVGTVILKQKFLDAEGTKTDLYTGMRKREPGFNPELGDWEFFTLDSSGRKVTARGKIESCMDCHTKYSSTDFVARTYLTAKEDGR